MSTLQTSATRIPLPQSYQVELSYSGEEEAGRFATAARSVCPGELVLSALPYVLVMNPSEFASGVYLTATATKGHAGTNVNDGTGNATSAPTSHKKKTKHASVNPSGSTWEAADADTDGCAAYTTCATWCSGCVSPILPGARIVNAVALHDVALDISAEQDALEEARAAAKASDTAAEDTTTVEHKALKKPTKSAKMRKDTAVELRQRLHESALVQREVALHAHRQRARADAFHDSLEQYDTWWKDVKSPANGATVSAGCTHDEAVVVGCTRCGVAVYCSQACWASTHTVQHVQSGECAVLRRVYPRVMKEYFSMGSGGGGKGRSHGSTSGGGGAATTVLMPGLPEVRQWARSTGEEKSLEAQNVLMAALVFSRAVKEGHAARWWSPRSSAETTETAAAAASTGTACVASPATPGTVAETGRPSTPPPAVPTAATLARSTTTMTESAVMPREAIALQETRQRLGLTGTVEVMDETAAAPFVATRRMTVSSSPRLAQPDSGEARQPAAPHSSSVMRDRLVTSAATFYGAGASRWPTARGTIVEDSTAWPQQELVVPAYADMASMITNLSVLSKDRKAVFASYYRRFVKLFLPWLPVFAWGLSPEATSARHDTGLPQLQPEFASHMLPEETFVRLCAAAQCNSFGIYSKDDRCIGFAVYPEASYFNHSCYPNLCRVMQNGARAASFYALRPILAGEPLTICYTDVQEQNTAERRRNLLHTYRFFCQCERCAGHVATTVRGGEGVSVGAIGLCTACAVRGYLRPVPPSALYPSAELAELCTCPLSDANAREAALPRWDLQDTPSRCCTVCQRVDNHD